MWFGEQGGRGGSQARAERMRAYGQEPDAEYERGRHEMLWGGADAVPRPRTVRAFREWKALEELVEEFGAFRYWKEHHGADVHGSGQAGASGPCGACEGIRSLGEERPAALRTRLNSVGGSPCTRI